MNRIENKTLDQERALYGLRDTLVVNCKFDGPADGESAFKECTDVEADGCFFNLRYPFWHDEGLTIRNSEMTELCRAALWYSHHITIADTKLHGIKALRECSQVKMTGCDIVSPEFGWSVHDMEMEDCDAQAEYFMMRSTGLHFTNVRMQGKYSFQYIEDSVFDSTVKGEYLAWYCENVTFENCTIIGTQPLCYCQGLKLINCKMVDCDLAFERSHVQASLTAPILSIKNPLTGSRITVPQVGEIIRDIDGAEGEVLVEKAKGVCA